MRTSFSRSQRTERSRAGWWSGTPASASAIVAIAVSQIGETQGCTRIVPSLLDQQVVKLLQCPDDRRRVSLVAQTLESDDRVDHRREDRAQAVGVLEVVDHPPVCGGETGLAPGAWKVAVGPLQDAVEAEERVRPGAEPVGAPRRGGQIVAEELGDTQLGRQRAGPASAPR